LLAVAVAACAQCRGGQSPTAPSPVPIPVVPPQTSRSRILAFGDSITAGVTSPAVSRLSALDAGLPQSYPFKLQSLLMARYVGQAITVANEGQPGEAVSDGVRRFSDLVRVRVPEVVIILHGVNDVTLLGMPGVGRVAAFINDMARAARFGGAEVIISTYPPQRAGGFRAAAPGVMEAYNAALRDVARGEGALLADFEIEVDARLIGFDGLHPTEEGYSRMADVLVALFRARYEVPSARASLEHQVKF
jgi:lysophospholipase L1-like esterase